MSGEKSLQEIGSHSEVIAKPGVHHLAFLKQSDCLLLCENGVILEGERGM